MTLSEQSWWSHWTELRNCLIAERNLDAMKDRLTPERRRYFERNIARLERLADAKEGKK